MSSECWRLTSCILIESCTQHAATSSLNRRYTAEPLSPVLIVYPHTQFFAGAWQHGPR